MERRDNAALADVREVRVLVEFAGRLFQAFKLAFSRTDASIYLVPYAKKGRYFFGAVKGLAGGEFEIKFREQLSADSNPKLSIHETGQVHIYAAGTPQAGPVAIPPLTDWTGEHLATVHPDHFDRLPEYRGKVRSTGAEIEHVMRTEPGVESGRFLVYLNGTRPLFSLDVPFTVTLRRPSLDRPLYVGVYPLAARALQNPETGSAEGVSVLAGWNPRMGDQPSDFLFLRGE